MRMVRGLRSFRVTTLQGCRSIISLPNVSFFNAEGHIRWNVQDRTSASEYMHHVTCPVSELFSNFTCWKLILFKPTTSFAITAAVTTIFKSWILPPWLLSSPSPGSCWATSFGSKSLLISIPNMSHLQSHNCIETPPCLCISFFIWLKANCSDELPLNKQHSSKFFSHFSQPSATSSNRDRTLYPGIWNYLAKPANITTVSVKTQTDPLFPSV